MEINKINATGLGYGMVYFPFSIYIPDDEYCSYNDTDRNYKILIEVILKLEKICNEQKESIEKKKKIINNFYGSKHVYDEAIDTFRNYVTSDSACDRTYKDYVATWENYDYTKCCNRIDVKKINKNDTESTENNLKTEESNEVTAFTSGEISW